MSDIHVCISCNKRLFGFPTKEDLLIEFKGRDGKNTIIYDESLIPKVRYCIPCLYGTDDPVLMEKINYLKNFLNMDPDTEFFDLKDNISAFLDFGTMDTNEMFNGIFIEDGVIKGLDLSLCSIKDIPDDFFSNFTDLKFLNLSYNSINSLPENIRNLENLKVLLVEKNILSTLPKAFYDLTKLEIVSFMNNRISEIPSEISKLVNLEALDIRENVIYFISMDIFNLNLVHFFADELTDQNQKILIENASEFEEFKHYIDHNRADSVFSDD